jgi:hypothetical protein
MKITGDARKLLDTFVMYATRECNEDLAAALWYDPQALRIRAEILKEQMEAEEEERINA